jgi:hypothetical protein
MIGNQDEVVWHSNEHGSIRGARNSIAAVRRKFRKTEYYPAQGSDHGESLFNAVMLPNMDGPGFAWGEQRYHAPAQVLEALEQIKSGGESSRIMTELTPIEPFKPAR